MVKTRSRRGSDVISLLQSCGIQANLQKLQIKGLLNSLCPLRHARFCKPFSQSVGHSQTLHRESHRDREIDTEARKKKRKGKERKGKERKGRKEERKKERKEGRKGKERKGKGREGKERKK